MSGTASMPMPDRQTRLASRQALHKMRAAPPGQSFAVWEALRTSVGCMVPLQLFYVTWIERDGDGVVTTTFPYVFTNDTATTSEGAAALPISEDGLTAWMMNSAEPYQYAMDSGARIRRGHTVDGENEDIRDAAAFHMRRPDGSVVGFIAVLARKPNAFTQDMLSVLSWLAAQAYLAYRRVQQGGPAEHARPLPEFQQEQLVNVMSEELLQVRRRLGEVVTLLHEQSNRKARDAATALERDCAALQVWLMDTYGYAGDMLAELTNSERVVAGLIGAGDSIAEAASARNTSENTIKAQLRSIYHKLGIHSRVELEHLYRATPGTGSPQRSS